MRQPRGALMLVLHAHLPFVRHPDDEDHLEEEWLREAVLECYLPLLELLERLHADHVPVRLTLSLTPTLVAMLEDPLLRARIGRRLDRQRTLAAREVRRTATTDGGQNAVARFYAERLDRLAAPVERPLPGCPRPGIRRAARPRAGRADRLGCDARVPPAPPAVPRGGARAGGGGRLRARPRLRAEALRLLAARVRLLPGPRAGPRRRGAPLHLPRCARARRRRAAAAPVGARSGVHRGGRGGLRPRSGGLRAGVERRRRLPGRPGVPRLLPGHRLGSAGGRARPGARAGQAPPRHRLQVPPHHGPARGEGRLGPGACLRPGPRARAALRPPRPGAHPGAGGPDGARRAGGRSVRRRALRALVVRGAGVPRGALPRGGRCRARGGDAGGRSPRPGPRPRWSRRWRAAGESTGMPRCGSTR